MSTTLAAEGRARTDVTAPIVELTVVAPVREGDVVEVRHVEATFALWLRRGRVPVTLRPTMENR